MNTPAFERRWREALLDAMIPAPPDGALPPMSAVDRSAFWARFAETAPLALRFAMVAASCLIAGLLPPLLGYGRPLDRLDAATREAVLVRAARLPGSATLLEVVKIVACFAYFDDARVQAHVRGAPAS